MDKIYVKVKGQWMYQYRAVDKFCETIDYYFAKSLDKKASIIFFKKAIGFAGKPTVVNIDKSGSNAAALVEINKTLIEAEQIKIRQNKYLNNMIEQDHRFINKITRAILGFKSIHSARATLQVIELHHILRKGQHVNSANQSIFERFYSLAT